MRGAETRLVEDLVERFPALRSIYDEHLRDNGELLPHVFFGDVARYAERLYMGQEREALEGLLDVLERAWGDGPHEVEELIQVSFIENLQPWDGRKAGMRELLGPHLQDAWSKYL
jgi:hypothetical protein